jgi:hypothetical protein
MVKSSKRPSPSHLLALTPQVASRLRSSINGHNARDQCHASIKLFAIEILVRLLFLPTLVSLLDIYSEPSDSTPLLYSVLPFRASSCVKAINYVQLKHSQVVQVYLVHQALSSVLSCL